MHLFLPKYRSIKLLFCLILALVFQSCSHQNKKTTQTEEINTSSLPENIDSLKKLLKSAKYDTLRMRILDAMSIIEDNDSLMLIYDDSLNKMALSLQSKNDEKLKTLSKTFLANTYHRKGFYYAKQGRFDEAFGYNTKSLQIRSEVKDTNGIIKSLYNLSNLSKYMGEFAKAIDFSKKTLKYSIESNNIDWIARSYNNIGNLYWTQGNYTQALDYFQNSLVYFQKSSDSSGIANAYNNSGLVYKALGEYKEAIECFHKCLKINEIIFDSTNTANALTNLGNIYLVQGAYPQAMSYYEKSAKIFIALGDNHGISICFNNIGNIYSEQNNDTKALEYYLKSLDLESESEDLSNSSALMNNIANIYAELGDRTKALDYYLKCLNAALKSEDAYLTGMAYTNLGNNYLNTGNAKKALEYANKAYNLAKETGNIVNKRDALQLLDKIYNSNGNYKLSRKFYGEFIEVRDTINNEQTKKLSQQKYFQYEYDKKASADSISHAKALQIKNLIIANQSAESKRQRSIIISSLAGLILVISVLVILFRAFRITRRQKLIIEKQKKIVDEKNRLLEKQNQEISTQRDEIKSQRDEIKAQRDIVTQQKEQIETIHKKITDSINYAKRIQDAVLPDLGTLNFSDYFVLYKPKDIVSGDFYWATTINHWKIIALADCTGHGVPGAFMSMLGISFLNEIVKKKDVTQANQILIELRKNIIHALQQKGVQNEQKDGMNISLLVINSVSNECQWAGAYNSLYVIKHKTSEFIELKPDKMPIAIHPIMNEFNNHTFTIEQNDVIYFFSDGFADQFGGPNTKKFMIKNFKELIQANFSRSMDKQKMILEETLLSWMEHENQNDDITVMGIKI